VSGEEEQAVQAKRLPGICQALLIALAGIGILALSLVVGACSGSNDERDISLPANTVALTSDAFADASSIPTEYTCEGQDISPPLRWSGAPVEAQAFVLLVDDPDAPGGTFAHWLIYDLQPSTTELPAGIPVDAVLPDGGKQGKNDFGKIGYGGPCPPKGSEHRYRFRIFALDAPLNLDSGKSKGDVEHAMQGHILGGGELTGRFKR
jgi:Raf kinase inhibitor-like YbhB/YbcL family protein